MEVYNKTDREDAAPRNKDGTYRISAKTGAGLDALLTAIETGLSRTQTRVELVIPYEKYDAMNTVRAIGTILSESYENDGTHLVAMLETDKLYQLQKALGIPFEKPKADWENDDD